ncbi:MAG TPA: hypothetical protein VJH65_04005 [Candidatus Nanoarchaeia archaeon]|nr:hypothetical protein [Candidatus Nanoarchaeia archaeon]
MNDLEREEELLSNKIKTSANLSEGFIRKIYRLIIDESARIEKE